MGHQQETIAPGQGKRRRRDQPGPFEGVRFVNTGRQTRPRRIEELVERVRNRFVEGK